MREGIFVVGSRDTRAAYLTVLAHFHANFLYVLSCFILVRCHRPGDKPIIKEDT